MAERRPLLAGLNSDTEKATEFIYGERTTPPKAEPVAEPKPTPKFYGPGRVPITMRVKQDVASSLKRLSLERQLQGIEPNAMQDIVEEALEQWLAQNQASESSILP